MCVCVCERERERKRERERERQREKHSSNFAALSSLFYLDLTQDRWCPGKGIIASLWLGWLRQTHKDWGM